MKGNEFRASIAKPILVAGAIIAVIAAWHFLGAGVALKQALQWISSLGTLAPIVFILLYILACVLFIPGSIMTIGAGVIFGVIRGSIYVSIGATIGATCAFLTGRYLTRGWIARRIAGNRNFQAIDAAVAQGGWKIVLLTRLSPIFPFNLVNYAYGVTKVRLRDYVLATWLGTLPGTVMYVYIGSLAGSIATIGTTPQSRPAAQWVLDGVGFVATIVVAVYTARIARKALSQQTRQENSYGSSPVSDHSARPV
jgi:uncharacterized membrane protein YdjX (TVP38/TMEM64 family)